MSLLDVANRITKEKNRKQMQGYGIGLTIISYVCATLLAERDKITENDFLLSGDPFLDSMVKLYDNRIKL